ncbi:MAG: hypothetical protein DDT30_01924 [Dehalococcoidia bacterium]|nr:hypothetical protein [Bacillota bacterium]
MKKIFVFVFVLIIIAVVAVGLRVNALIGFSERFENETEAEIFTDSTGIQWRVLAEDEKGNRLIITEHVYGLPVSGLTQYNGSDNGITVSTRLRQINGLTQFNSKNVYTRLGQSDVLRFALDTWFTNILAPELKEIALPAGNVNNDVWLTPGGGSLFHERAAHENETSGLTFAATGTASPENSLFILSISEVNKYHSLGTLNKQGVVYLIEYGIYVPAEWWLRSPGSCLVAPVTIMTAGDTTGAFIDAATATESYSFRPALWISRKSSPDLVYTTQQ